MELKDREFRKLKLGLALKKIMDKQLIDDSSDEISKNTRTISFRKLETDSGIRHASIVEIVNGKKNAAWSTIDALLEGLEINLTQFASVYDLITKEEVEVYKQELNKKKQEREKKKLNRKTAKRKNS